MDLCIQQHDHAGCVQDGAGEQQDEVFVVFAPNTVIDPDAVMIEALSAPLTLSAVLWELLHAGIAVVAVVIILAVIELDLHNPMVPLQTHSWVSRIGPSCQITKKHQEHICHRTENAGEKNQAVVSIIISNIVIIYG